MTSSRLLLLVRDRAAVRRYSPRTTQAYVGWIVRYVRWTGLRHPSTLGGVEVRDYLLERAAAIDAQERAGGVDVAELRRAALEAGIGAPAFDAGAVADKLGMSSPIQLDRSLALVLASFLVFALWSTAKAIRWTDRHGWDRLP